MSFASTFKFEGLDAARAAVVGMNAKAAVVGRQNVAQASALVIRLAMANFEGAHKRKEPRVPNSSNYPNIVTGTLRRSIRSSGIARTGPTSFEATVGPTAIYGRRVELGFNGQGSYPFFGPAVKKARARLQDITTSNAAMYFR